MFFAVMSEAYVNSSVFHQFDADAAHSWRHPNMASSVAEIH
jgi:hypothetical protein